MDTAVIASATAVDVEGSTISEDTAPLRTVEAWNEHLTPSDIPIIVFPTIHGRPLDRHGISSSLVRDACKVPVRVRIVKAYDES
jgi:hypothetical protein